MAATGSADAAAYVYDAGGNKGEQGDFIHKLDGHKSRVYSAIFHPTQVIVVDFLLIFFTAELCSLPRPSALALTLLFAEPFVDSQRRRQRQNVATLKILGRPSCPGNGSWPLCHSLSIIRHMFPSEKIGGTRRLSSAFRVVTV